MKRTSSQRVAKANAEKVHSLHDAGLTTREIAEQVGLSACRVRRIVQLGRPEQRERMTGEEVRDACVYGIWWALRAVALGCRPERAIDAVATAGLVRKGGVAV